MTQGSLSSPPSLTTTTLNNQPETEKTDRMLYALGFIDQSLVSHHQLLPEDDWVFVVILEKKRRVIRYLHNVVLTFSELVHFTDSNSKRLHRCQLKQSTWNRKTDITDEMLCIALIDQFTGLSSWDTPRRWVHYHHLAKIILQFLLVSEERSDRHCTSSVVVVVASHYFWNCNFE